MFQVYSPKKAPLRCPPSWAPESTGGHGLGLEPVSLSDGCELPSFRCWAGRFSARARVLSDTSPVSLSLLRLLWDGIRHWHCLCMHSLQHGHAVSPHPPHLFWIFVTNNGLLDVQRTSEVISSSLLPSIKVLCLNISSELIHDQLPSLGSSFLSWRQKYAFPWWSDHHSTSQVPRVSSAHSLKIGPSGSWWRSCDSPQASSSGSYLVPSARLHVTWVSVEYPTCPPGRGQVFPGLGSEWGPQAEQMSPPWMVGSVPKQP